MMLIRHIGRTRWLAAFLLMAWALNAQSSFKYQLVFKKEFVSWNWNAAFQNYIQTGKNSYLTLEDKFVSNLYKPTRSIAAWRDENKLEVAWRKRFSARLSTRLLAKSRIFEDENTTRKFSRHLLAQEIIWQPYTGIELKPAIGWELEEDIFNRSLTEDSLGVKRGFGTGSPPKKTVTRQEQARYSQFSLKMSQLNLGGYSNDTEISNIRRDFPSRKNQESLFLTRLYKKFSPFAFDSLRMGYQFSDNRYPVSLESSEQVLIHSQFLLNKLYYTLSEYAGFSIVTKLNNRIIERRFVSNLPNNRRQETTLENRICYRIQYKALEGSSEVLFSQSEEDNSGIQSDITALQTSFNNAFQLCFSPKDQWWGRFSYTKREYNTPLYSSGGEAPEERDEQRFDIYTGYQHQFTPYFSLVLKSNVVLNHQIYLSARYSQKNNWNQIYRLSAEFNHQFSQWIRHRNRLEIMSNFTVFDFEDTLNRINSFVFRKLIYRDSLSIRLTSRLFLNNVYQLEKDDSGRFFKKEFAQQKSKAFSRHFIYITLQHKNILGIQLSTGLSLFLRKEWSFLEAAERKQVRWFRRIAPRLNIIYPASSRLILNLDYMPTVSLDALRSIDEQHFKESRRHTSSGMFYLKYFF